MGKAKQFLKYWQELFRSLRGQVTKGIKRERSKDKGKIAMWVLAVLVSNLSSIIFPFFALGQSSQWQWPRNSPYIGYNDYSSDRTCSYGPCRHAGIDVHETSSLINGSVLAIADGVVVGIFRPTAETSSLCNSNCVRAYTNYSYPHYDTYSRVFNGEIIRDHVMQGVVIIRHSLPAGGSIYNGGTIYSLYAHLSTIPTSLTVGQTISCGTVLGTTGGGGNTHVHLKIKNQPYRHDPLRNWGGSTGRVPYWGYTPDNPNNYGYWDPWIFIHTIGNIDPPSGSTGTEVTLNGSKFNSLSDFTEAKVEFGGIQATVLSYSDAQIRVTAPAGSGTVHVRLAPTKFYRYQYLPVGVKNWITYTYSVSQTLAVSLAANPSSGTAPLNGVDLTATVSGTATGTINYTFYCNRSDTGTNITSGYAFKIDHRNPDGTGGTIVYQGAATGWTGGTTFSVYDVCNYSSAGTYTAKVIAERGGFQAEARTTITVNPTPQYTLTVNRAGTREKEAVLVAWGFLEDFWSKYDEGGTSYSYSNQGIKA